MLMINALLMILDSMPFQAQQTQEMDEYVPYINMSLLPFSVY